MDDIFVLFKSAEHLSKFCDYFNMCHQNMSFSFEQEKKGKLSFLDVEVSHQEGHFVTTAYRKPIGKFFANNIQIWYGIYPGLLLFQNLF